MNLFQLSLQQSMILICEAFENVAKFSKYLILCNAL